MSKRVFIVHGWDGKPDEHWLPWLARELRGHDFIVQVPRMPDTGHPNMARWVSELESLVGVPDRNTYFVGHSIGCLAILRYLEHHGETVAGVVLVAPWVTLATESISGPDDAIIAAEWTTGGFDWSSLKKSCPHFVGIFSEDDPDVPFKENMPVFRDKLGAEIIAEDGKGHFTADDGVTELPSALKSVLEMSA